MINSLKEIRFFEKRIKFYDNIKSTSVYWIEKELNREYDLKNIKIEDNDLIIDIGAHVGVVSTYISKINKNCKIYSYEPSLNSFNCLAHNLLMNDVKNVKIFNYAVTSDGRDVKMMMPFTNTGGSSLIFEPQNQNYFFNYVKSVNINQLINEILIDEKTDKIKILKIDCEGSEYEILNSLSPEFFNKIEYLIGEFHTIQNDETKTPQKLLEHCQQYIDPNKIKVVFL
jgi:FkbM family methyltransferase